MSTTVNTQNMFSIILWGKESDCFSLAWWIVSWLQQLFIIFRLVWICILATFWSRINNLYHKVFLWYYSFVFMTPFISEISLDMAMWTRRSSPDETISKFQRCKHNVRLDILHHITTLHFKYSLYQNVDRAGKYSNWNRRSNEYIINVINLIDK